MSRLRRLLGLAGIATSLLRQDRARTVFAVIGVAFAVLSVTLFAGVGMGVQSTGEQKLEQSEVDLWVTGGPIEVQPSSVGRFRNPIVDAHDLSAELEENEGVNRAAPIALQVVYVSTDGENFESTLGTGVIDEVSGVGNGTGFQSGSQDSSPHYAGGDYDGPMTHEVIISPRTAEKYDLEVNDTLYVGGTIGNARRNEFTVVGNSSGISSLLGTNTVTLRLSELQTLTGTAYDDRATLVAIFMNEGADVSEVETEIEESHPELTVRTNREQFLALLERQGVIIVGGISLVLLAVFSGMVLSLNLFLSLTYAQRTDFTVYRALGGARGSVLAMALVEAGMIAGGGVVMGLLATPIAATGLNAVAASVTGFESIVRVPLVGYLLGAGVAVVFGVIGTAWSVRRITSSDITRTLGG